MGLTVIDSLDTLLILGLDEEFAEARHWVANHLDFEQMNPVSVRAYYLCLDTSVSIGESLRPLPY